LIYYIIIQNVMRNEEGLEKLEIDEIYFNFMFNTWWM